METNKDIANALMTESLLNSDGPCYTGHLLPEMDIFSAGCALLELWSEGTAPFEFSQLLAYRAGEMELVNKHLNGIENEKLRNLIASMIILNPKHRKSAEIYLDEERGRLFPEYFYSFLQSYMQMFSFVPIMPPDDKIRVLYKDIGQIVVILTNQHVKIEENEDGTCTNTVMSDNEGLLIITALVTSCIRGLQHCITKLRSLEILKEIAQHTSSENILDRIIPYIVSVS